VLFRALAIVGRRSGSLIQPWGAVMAVVAPETKRRVRRQDLIFDGLGQNTADRPRDVRELLALNLFSRSAVMRARQSIRDMLGTGLDDP
jgi:hypothetical protein